MFRFQTLLFLTYMLLEFFQVPAGKHRFSWRCRFDDLSIRPKSKNLDLMKSIHQYYMIYIRNLQNLFWYLKYNLYLFFIEEYCMRKRAEGSPGLYIPPLSFDEKWLKWEWINIRLSFDEKWPKWRWIDIVCFIEDLI